MQRLDVTERNPFPTLGSGILIGDRPCDAGEMPVGAENLVTSCDLHVLVYEAAEPGSS
jgi:hypothetical protein